MHVSDTLIGQTMESDAIKMRSIVKAVATHQINAHQTSKLAFAKRGYKQRKENAFDLVKPVTSIIHSLSPWILIPCSSNFWILLSFRLLPLHPDLKTPPQSPTTHKILPTSDITQKQRHNKLLIHITSSFAQISTTPPRPSIISAFQGFRGKKKSKTKNPQFIQ